MTVPVVEVRVLGWVGRAQTVPLSALVDDGTYTSGWRVELPDGSVRQVLRGSRFAKFLDRGWNSLVYQRAYDLAKRISMRLAYAHMKSGVREWSTPIRPDRDEDFYCSPSAHVAAAASSVFSSRCLDKAMSPWFRLNTRNEVVFEATCRVVAVSGRLRATYDPDRRRLLSYTKPSEATDALSRLVSVGMWTPAEATPALDY